MRQQRASIDEATCDSENAADAKGTSQHRVSRYGETLASENEAHSE